ncbi:hypothetical protein P43SY_001657 [Pythium insidiosum]|uniref:Peptidase M14 domain-containing protein n=1 Tax=Pythium insidiosum TaxID=114742 RepID=A0AAD5Q905_PYTIN|nr:hypothetical protein P43SY_001657 [Pythium insidiosum]
MPRRLALVALALAIHTALCVSAKGHRVEFVRPLPTATKLFRVHGAKPELDALIKDAGSSIDVWRVRRSGDGSDDAVDAEIAATPQVMQKLLDKRRPSRVDIKLSRGGHLKATLHSKLRAKELRDLDEIAARDRVQVAACRNATEGFMQDIGKVVKLTDSDFFDCFRPADEILWFLDVLATRYPESIVKLPFVSTTYENRSIPVFKISSSARDKGKSKKAIFVQSLLHAREWIGGSSTLFTMAAMLDDLHTNATEMVSLLNEYDWFFAPIANVDGYINSWEQDRYWRVNRHAMNGYDGVDLNRNYPPQEYFNVDPADVDAETYPGPSPLSESETKGLYEFVTNLDGLSGVVDMHSYGALVLRPFSDARGEPPEPYRSAMRELGDAVRDAASSPTQKYVSEPSGALYPAYGCFDDAIFRFSNFTVPSITIEVEGDDFTAPQSTIREVGARMYRALRQFGKQATKYGELMRAIAEERDE